MANSAIHASVGMAILNIIPIWWISFPIIFLSHFILDLYPEAAVYHNNFKAKSNIFFLVIQFLLSIFVIITCIIQQSWILFLAAFLANLPDVWDGINFLLKKEKIWFTHTDEFYKKYQGFSMKPFQNAILDLMFVSLILLLIIF
jgi:hypothetical protein